MYTFVGQQYSLVNIELSFLPVFQFYYKSKLGSLLKETLPFNPFTWFGSLKQRNNNQNLRK